MSIRLMSRLWDNGDPDLSGNRLLVAMCLADHANDVGVCWPSIDRIVRRTRIDKRSVLRHLKALEELGYLEVIRKIGKSNRYILRSTRPAASNLDVTSDNLSPVTNCHHTSDKLSPVPVTNCHHTSDKLSPKSSKKRHILTHQKETSSTSDDDALIDPDITKSIAKWREVFAGTEFEASPPVGMFHKWLAWYGPDVLLYMVGQAQDKSNPAGWLYTTYDNWRKDGEVAPYITRQVEAARLAAMPTVTKTLKVDFGDGMIQEMEVKARG